MLSFAVMLNAENVVMLIIFSSFHELGHLVALAIFKGKPDSLRLSYYGLALKYSTQLLKWQETIVLLSGPIVNLILYLVFKDNINLLLFTLNMLPIYPIDFGRVIRLYSYTLSKMLSIIFTALLLALSLYLLIVYRSFSLIFIVCYLIIYSINY